MQILLLADIHGNYPALKAVAHHFEATSFDFIINCGDSTVYGPYPNEVLNWLRAHDTISILGNTDKKVIKLLQGKTFKKPSKSEKRIMYSTTADSLSPKNRAFLLSLTKKQTLLLDHATHNITNDCTIGIFHGSPEHPHEFIFDNTPDDRFMELANNTPYQIIVTGHSHTPYHKYFGATHFINPGSVGRMFDGNSAASCATISLTEGSIRVNHFRIEYDVWQLVEELRRQKLPEIYERMFVTGRKLN